MPSICIRNTSNNKEAWVEIDSSDTPDCIQERVEEEVGDGSWAVLDYEGFTIHRDDEYPDFEDLIDEVNCIDEWGLRVVEAAQDAGACADGTLYSWIEDHYIGQYESAEEWAEEYLTDTGSLDQVPDSLRYYINFESWARDAELSGDVTVIDIRYNCVAVFHNH